MATLLENLLFGFNEILSAPGKDPSIWWLLTPIILFWLVIEIYFGRHKNEKLGWNTALGNGLNIFWVVIISARALFDKDLGLYSLDKLIFVLVISFYSFFIIIMSFTHTIKENIFFLMASPTAVYFLSAVAVLWIHNLITISLWVLVALFILYFAVLILETIIKKLIPAAKHHNDMHLGKI